MRARPMGGDPVSHGHHHNQGHEQAGQDEQFDQGMFHGANPSIGTKGTVFMANERPPLLLGRE